jgi:hypothetical protein
MKTAGFTAMVLILALGQAPALADAPEQGYQLGVSLDAYPDRWELPRRHDDPLATVPSSRMTLNAHLDNFFRVDEGFLLGLDGRFYWQDRTAGVEPRPKGGSELDYRGMDMQALSGYRFGAPGDVVRYDMRLGLGYRDVSRSGPWGGSLGDGDSGWLYTQFSAGPRFNAGNWRGFLELGVRVPLESDDRVYAAGADPVGNGRRSAGFISFQNLFQLSDRAAFRLDLYYDSQRYGLTDGASWHSPARDELSGDGDVFGLEMGLDF